MQTKEQIKQLKAEKAALAAKQPQKHLAVKDQEGFSIPRPPSRLPPPNSTAQRPAAASFHADSQATRLNDGLTPPTNVHSEPSVNQQSLSRQKAAPKNVTNAPPSNNTGGIKGGQGGASTTGAALPAGFFEDTAPAPSFEGSTGPDSLDLLIQQQQQDEEEEEEEQEEQQARANGDSVIAGVQKPAAPGGTSIPQGFFDNATADANARHVDSNNKPKKTEAELDDEYAVFMQQVETDAAVGAEVAAVEEEEQAEDKETRDQFEHL